MKRKLLLILAYFTICTASAQPTIGFSELITGLVSPVDIANANDGTGRLFIVQQTGQIMIYSGGGILPTPFLNVSSLITGGGERGLLSVAFHPQYSSNRYFFIYYTGTGGAITIAQYRTPIGTPDIADPLSAKVIFTVPHPAGNHNGGKLNFGPDGNLYFAIGDGGGAGDVSNNAQTGTTNLGKMIRINVDNFEIFPYYSIPPSNPFVLDPAVNDEIFAVGLRNPWRWSFDKQNGDMWIGDVGQGAWEEINYRTSANMSGVNYGWRCLEGTHNYDLSLCTLPLANYAAPVFEYPHNATGGFVVTGGYVYRGAEYIPLQGYYIFCDYANTNGWLMKDNGAGGFTVRQQNNFPLNVTSFGEGEDGTLYTLTGSGALSKIILTGVLPIQLINFAGMYQAGNDQLQWNIVADQDLSGFEIEQSTDGTRFQTIATIPAQPGITNYRYSVPDQNKNTRFYRLKILHHGGSIQYSSIVTLTADLNTKITIRYKGGQQLNVYTPMPLKQLRIVNSMGQVVKTYANIAAGSQVLFTGNLLPGVHWVQCFGESQKENFKIAVVN